MLGTMMDFPLTLRHIFERAQKLYGEVEIVTRLPDKSLHHYRFADFHKRARKFAAALQRAGLKRGERVGTMMWNSYAHLECYFGTPIMGGVLHTLNFRLHAADLEYIANHAEDRFIVVDDVLLPVLEASRPRLKAEKIIVARLAGKPLPKDCIDYEAFIADVPEYFDEPVLDENEAAGMCYTSGTTGRPKGVVYSHRALVLHSLTESLAITSRLSFRDSLLVVVPMFHVNSWGLPFSSVMVGAKLVLPGPHLDAESLLDLMEREKATIAAGVPTIWNGILHALDKEPKRWHLQSGLRTLVGGSSAPEAMIRGFDRHGVEVIHAWGMTEMTPLGALSGLKPALDALPENERYAFRAKQGMPNPMVEMRIVNDRGEALWDGKTMGELQVRGPCVAASYYRDDSQKDKWTDDGWFRTGDVATIDSQGYMKIADRTKDLIKSGGEWISSVDLENALMGHPAVKEAAVIAIPHPKWDERPLAAIVLKPDQRVEPQALADHLAASFAKWWLPNAYVFIEEIPKTSAGKFHKLRLREQFKDWHWDS